MGPAKLYGEAPVVPVVISIAQAAKMDPFLPTLGATLAASLGFMLPVSTPCNAIVYGSGMVPLTRMIRYGLLLDIVGVAVDEVLRDALVHALVAAAQDHEVVQLRPRDGRVLREPRPLRRGEHDARAGGTRGAGGFFAAGASADTAGGRSNVASACAGSLISCRFATTRVRPRVRLCSASGDAPTTRSQASRMSACWAM